MAPSNYAIANANSFRYRGYYYDQETGLYFLNARYYSPEWRRFISPNNASTLNPQTVNGLNLYVYASNNPIGFTPRALGLNEYVSNGMLSSLSLCGVTSGGVYLASSNVLSIKFPSQNLVSLALDFTAGMSGALSVLRWTKNNPEFYEFWYTAYGISKYEMLNNLKSPITKTASFISYSLVAYDTYTDVMDHINAGDLWQTTVASGLVKAATGTLNVWASSKLGATIGGKVGAAIGGVPGFVIGTASGMFVGILINGIFYTEVNGNSIAGHIEDGIEWFLDWIS